MRWRWVFSHATARICWSGGESAFSNSHRLKHLNRCVHWIKKPFRLAKLPPHRTRSVKNRGFY